MKKIGGAAKLRYLTYSLSAFLNRHHDIYRDYGCDTPLTLYLRSEGGDFPDGSEDGILYEKDNVRLSSSIDEAER